ncbi:3-phenylpropionate/trans-cinnamate dioxygenase ferredoxin reductase subunit [Sanguibacter gelidistatuariae]|uniref:3-phenylpropionate/trans-cinnamate dioxygenase ferredoxin reductase subunit n=1 Tax=Sanguibacter gelidistatuariae TaxID=1814289 RepID=A0A1G6QHN5_9MICO|nr:FAD-dependent oxidoreductase [Sanguibacter gelidistatuariae]SDC91197.1 3-phenylpropionate/trans-cinnamate dioxygenase ferredoxin reductase subunit [Sanguibacter gelidistatuariae]
MNTTARRSETFLVIGGGLAGASAARTLRTEGFDGRLVLLAGEDEVPYIRPPLSKEFLTGAAERKDTWVEPEAWYAGHDVELLRGCTATSIDVAEHVVVLDNHSRLAYTRALVATGASPRRLPLEEFPDFTGVHYLRTLASSEQLRAELREGGRRVVVVGAGWIGLEVASAARGYGNEVTVLGRETTPLEPVLGAELGSYFADVHRRNGVTLRMGVDVAGFTGAHDGVHLGLHHAPHTAHGAVTAVVLRDGEKIPADVVVVGIGAVPNTELASGVGLVDDNGIVVDASLSAGLDVWAAGDVARAFHPILGKHLRIEHWANAEHQGAAAARSMLGQPVSYDRVPYFYTDQFDLGMEFSGYGDLMPGASVVYRGDRASGEFIAFWVAPHGRGNRVVAGMNVNVWDVNPAIDALIASGQAVDLARLRDPSTPLEDLSSAPTG